MARWTKIWSSRVVIGYWWRDSYRMKSLSASYQQGSEFMSKERERERGRYKSEYMLYRMKCLTEAWSKEKPGISDD